MARNESDREDLLREAVALTRRIEFTIRGVSENVVAGFRDNGWLSIYFGQSLMYQFDETGALRRAFADGKLFRTQGNTLAELVRSRGPKGPVLERRDLDAAELGVLLSQLTKNLEHLADSISRGEFQTVGQVPEIGDVLGAVAAEVAEILEGPIELGAPINARR